MAVPQQLLDILACPVCRTPVTLTPDRQAGQPSLKCATCGGSIHPRPISPSCWWMKHALKKTETGELLAELSHGARVLIIRLRPLGDMVLLTPRWGLFTPGARFAFDRTR